MEFTEFGGSKAFMIMWLEPSWRMLLIKLGRKCPSVGDFE